MLHGSQKRLARCLHRFTLINRNYTLLWLGSSISLIGDTLFTTVLTLWIGTLLHNQSYAPLTVSGIALAAALPALLISPFAGVFVDRWQKQKTMRSMDVTRAILVLSLLLVSGPLPLPLLSAQAAVLPMPIKLGAIYLVVAAMSSLSQFFNPSTKALLKEIVPEEKLTRAFALTTGTGMVVWAIGSALAGICYANLGVSWAIILNAASFSCSWMLIRRMHISEPAAEATAQKERLHRMFKDLREGLRFIGEKLLLRTIIRTESLLAFGLAIINTLAFFFVTQNLHVPVSLYGLFCAVPSLGGILGTWLVDRSAAKIGATRVYYCAMLVSGIVMVLTALQSQPLIALIGIILINVANSHAEAVVGPLILNTTPEKMTGRVFSTFGTATTISSLLATFLSGYLSSTLLHTVDIHLYAIDLNATSMLNSCAGIALIVGGLYAYRYLRKFQ
ncbi:MAG TPA: MFS transporter [Ktedonobacteraceae bacterium]|jgi:MFS family permease